MVVYSLRAQIGCDLSTRYIHALPSQWNPVSYFSFLYKPTWQFKWYAHTLRCVSVQWGRIFIFSIPNFESPQTLRDSSIRSLLKKLHIIKVKFIYCRWRLPVKTSKKKGSIEGRLNHTDIYWDDAGLRGQMFPWATDLKGRKSSPYSPTALPHPLSLLYSPSCAKS